MGNKDAFVQPLSDLDYGNIFFVVAKRPAQYLEIEFRTFMIDGRPARLGDPITLAGDLGFAVDLGAHKAGTRVLVKWEVRTGIQVPDTDVIFGHCPNGKLTRLIRLEQRTLEPFQTLTGEFSTIPEKP